MGVGVGPKGVTDNLEFAFDSANKRSSFINDWRREHGREKWYCMESQTDMTYSMIYPGTEIYREDSNGNRTLIISASNTPQQGVMSIDQGYFYYGTKPVTFFSREHHFSLVPLSLRGKVFGGFSNRYEQSFYHLYAVDQQAIVEIYEEVPGGITGTPTTTITIPANTKTTYSVPLDDARIIFLSDNPIIMSVVESSADHDDMVLSPMSKQVYHKETDANTVFTSHLEAPSTINEPYWSDENLVQVIHIGDGAGNEAIAAVGIEYLSNTYSYGDFVRDYSIISPYDNEIVTSYWDSSNQVWKVWDSHYVTATVENPAEIYRSGDSGPGVTASRTQLAGASTEMISNTTVLWKWEGTKPFLLAINSSYQDEDNVWGWMSDNFHHQYPKDKFYWYDIGKNGYDAYLLSPNLETTYDYDEKAYYFDGNEGTLGGAQITKLFYDLGVNELPRFTIEMWAKSKTGINPANGNDMRFLLSFDRSEVFRFGIGADSVDQTLHPGQGISDTIGKIGMQYYSDGNGIIVDSYSADYDGNLIDDQWHHIVCSIGDTQSKYYVDGELVTTETPAQAFGNVLPPFTSTAKRYGVIGSGSETSDDQNPAPSPDVMFYGHIGFVRMYEEVLTDQEVKNNFNSLRKRYGV